MADQSPTTNLSRRAALTGAMAALSTMPAVAAAGTGKPVAADDAMVKAARAYIALMSAPLESEEEFNRHFDAVDRALMAADVSSIAGAVGAIECVLFDLDEGSSPGETASHCLNAALRFLRGGANV